MRVAPVQATVIPPVCTLSRIEIYHPEDFYLGSRVMDPPVYDEPVQEVVHGWIEGHVFCRIQLRPVSIDNRVENQQVTDNPNHATRDENVGYEATNQPELPNSATSSLL